MKTQIRTDLLRQLADHLVSSNRGHQIFDFSAYNYTPAHLLGGEKKKTIDKASCGTNGCAMGEMPVLRPEEWFFTSMGTPSLIGLEPTPYLDSATVSGMQYFNISRAMYEHLFIPIAQKGEWLRDLGESFIGEDATAEEVADNIRYFCELAEEGVIE